MFRPLPPSINQPEVPHENRKFSHFVLPLCNNCPGGFRIATRPYDQILKVMRALAPIVPLLLQAKTSWTLGLRTVWHPILVSDPMPFDIARSGGRHLQGILAMKAWCGLPAGLGGCDDCFLAVLFSQAWDSDYCERRQKDDSYKNNEEHL